MNNSQITRSAIWSAAGGGPARAGRAPHPGEIEARPVRTLVAGAGIQAAVVFDLEQRALVSDLGGGVRAFSREGELLWQQALEGAVSATPAVDLEQGRLFVGTHAGSIYCLSNEDGTVHWRTRLPSASDPRIMADLLFLTKPDRVITSSWGGLFHALDAASGAKLHTWNAGISPQSAASADSRNNIYCFRAVRDEGIFLIRVAPDGSETVLHRSAEDDWPANRAVVAAPPIIDDERSMLYFISNGGRVGRVHAWDLENGQVQWSLEFERALVAAPALRADGVLMIADMTGAVNGVRSGAIQFRYETGCEYLLAGPVCDGASRTYVGDPIGWLHRLDPGGEGKSLFEASRSIQARPAWSPAGELYLPAMDGRVHVFGGKLS
jgi:outer membrane protein assembly factor BamB